MSGWQMSGRQMSGRQMSGRQMSGRHMSPSARIFLPSAALLKKSTMTFAAARNLNGDL